MKKQLYIASQNAHKVSEIKSIISPFDFDVFGLDTVGHYLAPEETGSTFVDNALIKAKSLKKHLEHMGLTQTYVLADDSGLCCDDLNGAPGIYSARFAGENATDQMNNAQLILSFASVKNPTYKAHFECALALIEPDGKTECFQAHCEGKIILEPRGRNGFGYDSHLWIEHLQKTFAELAPDVKNIHSHRGQALQKLIEHISKHL